MAKDDEDRAELHAAATPRSFERLGEAVLIDGTWKVSIETACALHRLGGVECEL